MRRRMRVAGLIAALFVLSSCVTLPGRTGPAPGYRLLGGDRYGLAIDPDSVAAEWVRTHIANQPSGSVADVLQRKVALSPVARTFTAVPGLEGAVRSFVEHARKQQLMPMVVASFTESGCGNPGAIAALVRGLAKDKAILVLEPGLLAGRCADSAAGYLSEAVDSLHADAPNVIVLLDATSTEAPQVMARRLVAAGLSKTAGFTLNVGGYVPTAGLTVTANPILAEVTAATGKENYIVLVDSSRNGGVVSGTCNPAGAKLGEPSVLTDERGALQQAWLTVPGISDGPCGTAPNSRKGDFLPDLAYSMTL